ncbi:MAG: hypothetical protein RL244_924 [Pseudomonadota bacterium]|jgi:phospholipid-binding lipoprotein MlaA
MNHPSTAIRRTALRRTTAVLCLGSAAVLAGCATGPNAHPRDPLEPWNRGVYKFNDAVDQAVLKPVATVYTKVTPNFVQSGVRNFFNNLTDAWSAINSALQFKGQEAMDNFWRFTINTTFGLGGVFDVASEAQIPRVKQDFGLTLGRWGVGTGPYLMLPLLGPSTVRDTVALPVDMNGNPIGAIEHVPTRNQVNALSVINQRAQLLDASDLLNQAALDPYSVLRDAYLHTRDAGKRSAALAASAGASAPADGADSDGYEPPPEGMEGEAAAATPAAAASAVPPAGAASVPATPAAPSGPGADADGYEPPPEGFEPESGAPVQKGPTPYYVPAVPQLLEHLDPNWGTNFWRR